MPFFRLPTFVGSLVFCVALNAAATDDAEIKRALEGLPPEVRANVVLAPAHAASFSVDPADPLKVAVHAAAQMHGGDELRSRCLFTAGRQALKQNRPALAQEIAARTSPFHSALLLAEMAEILSVQDRSKAQETWDQAAAIVQQLKPWQAELVASKLVTSGNATDLSPAKVAIWFQSIHDPLNRFVTGAEIKAIEAQKSGTFEISLYRTERQAIQRQIPLPGLLDVSARLFEAALGRLKSSRETEQKQAAALIRNGLEILAGSHVIYAEPTLILAKKLYAAGHQDLARECFEQAERTLDGPPEELGKIRYLMADLWHTRGAATTIIPLLEAAEIKAHELEAMYQPAAFAWLAAAWEKAGSDDHASTLHDNACQIAITNLNLRIGWLGLYEISLCHAATARHLSAALTQRLNEKFNQ